jgi:exodeoxyribonuclease V alpha subunit
MDEGHCGLPIDQLTGLAERLLEVDAELIRSAIHHEIAAGEVIADTVGVEPCVFLKGLHLAERAIAERLIERTSGDPPWGHHRPRQGPALGE